MKIILSAVLWGISFLVVVGMVLFILAIDKYLYLTKDEEQEKENKDGDKEV